MHTANIIVTIICAVFVGGSTVVDVVNPQWVQGNMDKYGIPSSWLFRLGLAKTAGTVGVLVGLAVPWLGVAAAIGLVLYFVGAVIVITRAKVWPDIPYPLPCLAICVATLATQLAVAL